MKGGEKLKETVILNNPKVLSINDTNDIFVTLNICVLTDQENYNSITFTQDFIEGIVDNKSDYVGLPFVVNRENLESKEGSLTHELNEGVLETDVIGSFVDLWHETKEEIMYLMAEIRIAKRFPKTCEAIIDLYNKGDLFTSCEVLVSKYAEISEDGVRSVDYNDGKNPLIGSCIVDNPAEPRAIATLLVAEAYEKDIGLEQQGGEMMSKYNNGIDIVYHNKTEVSSIEFHEIEQQIYNALNPIDQKSGGRDWNYYITELYNDKVIVQDEAEYLVLYSIGYKIENDTVILDKKEDWIKGSHQFVPEGVVLDSLTADHNGELAELNKELNKVKEELESMSKEKELTAELDEDLVDEATEALEDKIKELEEEIVELKEEIEALTDKEAELNATIVSEKEAKTLLEEQVDELTVYKDNFVKAEQEAKVAKLKAKFSKLMSEETFASEEVVEAIKELDETTLNAIVVSEMATDSASKEEVEEPIVTSASKYDELVPSTIVEKYLG